MALYLHKMSVSFSSTIQEKSVQDILVSFLSWQQENGLKRAGVGKFAQSLHPLHH